MEPTRKRAGSTRRIERHKKRLPVVSEETIVRFIGEMEQDKNRLFREMAGGNPHLYQFIYRMYQLPNASKDMMLGVAVGMYHMLERELQNGKH